MGTEQVDHRRQRPRRSAKPPRLTREQQAWIDCRTRVGWQIDDYLRTRPPDEMRRAVEHLEEALRVGDHAVGLL